MSQHLVGRSKKGSDGKVPKAVRSTFEQGFCHQSIALSISKSALGFLSWSKSGNLPEVSFVSSLLPAVSKVQFLHLAMTLFKVGESSRWRGMSKQRIGGWAVGKTGWS